MKKLKLLMYQGQEEFNPLFGNYLQYCSKILCLAISMVKKAVNFSLLLDQGQRINQSLRHKYFMLSKEDQ